MMDDAKKARLRELCDAATPGPWVAEYSGEQGNCVVPSDAESTREAVCVTRLYHQQADAEFIAAARDALPRLLDENAEQAAEIARLKHGAANLVADVVNAQARAERAEAERDQAQAAIQQLRDVATDRTPHVYEGDCPDALDGHDRRDPACRACEALASTDVQARAGTQ